MLAYFAYPHQGASYGDASGGEPDSDFEVFVAEALREAGYEVFARWASRAFASTLACGTPIARLGSSPASSSASSAPPSLSVGE